MCWGYHFVFLYHRLLQSVYRTAAVGGQRWRTNGNIYYDDNNDNFYL